ncbi:L,D-transpeptidase family protein [Hymenobacter metallilatus]|uniref:L,D-transpeptidase family protein n=1 Tax=Hymenobacter metallilatus TaxID=2493666 RepID=UPI001C8C719C|nr:L,D-transpeptidase family protein [Hymenobacter metallilatus]
MLTARASLRSLLDTRKLGPAATYQALGLTGGAVAHTFYARHDFTTHWVEDAGWNSQARQALAVLGRAAEVGLDRNCYAWADLQSLPDSLRLNEASGRGQQLALSELRLTDALLQYLLHLQRGRLQPNTLMQAPTDSVTAVRVAEQLYEALQAPDLSAALLRHQPLGRGYRLLQKAWASALHASAADSLRLMQDTTAGFRRVALNLERLRWEPAADSEYAIVNIPAYRLQLIRNGQVLRTHKVIVGKPDMPTPVLSSRIAVFVVAPEWRVPYSIAVREFLPELQRDPSYLYDNHYRLYDGRGKLINPWRVNWQKMTPEKFAYAIRQRAGTFNALGNVVFYFPNQQTVFLHDTPARSAFTRPDRALSHGCVRVEKPLALAEYLLRRESRAPELTSMFQGVRTHEKQRFDLQRSLPIYLRYYTCETDKGKLVFLPDIYHQDAALALALFAQ